MKTIKSACKLQPKALEINVGDQIEQLDQIIHETNGQEYFKKTFITDGMKMLLSKGIARLAGKSNDSVFHLKQAMGGGKTHLMVGFGLLAKDAVLREAQIGTMPYQSNFDSAKIAAFNGRNNPHTYFWGEIARQLEKESLFKEYWESGAKAPDEQSWLKLFDGEKPILILLDEMPPYFHYYSTQVLGQGTIADVITRAFSNMLTAAQKKKNVCIVVSDLEAAYDTGGKLIQRALDDATQELGRAEVSITPVNLESNEIYEILRKRLFLSLPDKSEIAEIASVYASRLAEAARAKTVERSAEALATEIESTYPFHPSFKSIIALFKENEKFKQTRGLMELVSRLLKSVWESSEDVYLIGAQHFDLSIHDVREKLADISEMRDVIARDIWDSTYSAHAQIIDINIGNHYAKQVGTLLLTASLSTAVNSVRGLTESEMLECLIDPNHQGSSFRTAFIELQKSAWYLHQTQEGRNYFSRQENLTKKLQGYADKAPQNKVDELICQRLEEMYKPVTREAYEKVLPLPEMDDAAAVLKTGRALLIISPDGKTPPSVVDKFFKNELINKNNILVLTGDKSSIASIEKAARHVYAAIKIDNEISNSHPQRKELDEKKAQYEQDFHTTVLSVFDKLLFPGNNRGEDVLRPKVLDSTYPSNELYNGERQVVKTLTSDPIKLYTQITENFDALRARVESLLFGSQDEARKTDLLDKMKQKTQMPWLPSRGFDLLAIEAFQRGVWEDLGNGYITKMPKPKTTEVIISEESSPDDSGMVRLKIDVANAGKSPRIYYAEDGEVSESSLVLSDNTLATKALRVQFLAVDPTGKNLTGAPKTWKNRLTLRNKFNESSRKVELLVAPKGSIKYTLDGSEARNGIDYTGPIQLGYEETTVYVFAECDGLEEKRNFTFPKSGSNEVPIIKEAPAILVSTSPKRLDNSSKTYEGLKLAKEKGIQLEQVTLMVGSAPQVIHLSFGEIKISAEFIEKELAHLQTLLSPDAPMIMTFKKAYTHTGYDLEHFAKQLGIEIGNGEVEQR
ncbi:anti-phage-associated DUF499 domain-containing protein [Niallia sp.]|uniref:anti-phage-associated DUF499 domain-containing protein n=1 Tax=Niallia sp. TaxID=2837523 RepID=UPI0028A0806D|nr:anti-phage-associated DUF499 domain-containing protein [Niallia sp.]